MTPAFSAGIGGRIHHLGRAQFPLCEPVGDATLEIRRRRQHPQRNRRRGCAPTDALARGPWIRGFGQCESIDRIRD